MEPDCHERKGFSDVMIGNVEKKFLRQKTIIDYFCPEKCHGKSHILTLVRSQMNRSGNTVAH